MWFYGKKCVDLAQFQSHPRWQWSNCHRQKKQQKRCWINSQSMSGEEFSHEALFELLLLLWTVRVTSEFTVAQNHLDHRKKVNLLWLACEFNFSKTYFELCKFLYFIWIMIIFWNWLFANSNFKFLLKVVKFILKSEHSFNLSPP